MHYYKPVKEWEEFHTSYISALYKESYFFFYVSQQAVPCLSHFLCITRQHDSPSPCPLFPNELSVDVLPSLRNDLPHPTR